MKVLGKRVLVEQKMTKKESKIIMAESASDNQKFDIEFKIVQLGKDVDADIKIGDKPIFGQHTQFEGIKVLEKDDKGMTANVIVHQDDIIGIDD